MTLDLKQLIARGYFPAEVTPAFTSESLADFISSGITSLDYDYLSSGVTGYQLQRHSIAKSGVNRRTLSTPNPVAFANLSEIIVNNWFDLEKFFSKSLFSLSSPTINLKTDGRAIRTKLSHAELNPERISNRYAAKYLVKTDISRFYPSIYTHSIPWALHTKSVAKRSRGHKSPLLGNKIDRASQKLQDMQTMGIPVSPDTSLVIAEIILSSVDDMLSKYSKKIVGFRHVDDFEFAFKSFNEAEDFLAFLTSVLHDFELELNSSKTKILELPLPVEKPWISRISNFNLKNGNQISKVIQFFDLIFNLHNDYPDEHVLKYAIPVLKNVNIQGARTWNLIQNCIFQALIIETSTLNQGVKLLFDFCKKGFPINIAKMGEVLNDVVIQKSSMQHVNEILWAVWALIVWQIPLNTDAARAVSDINDPYVVLSVLDARNQGLVPSGLNTIKWENFMREESLYNENWLLAYEANVKGWLPNKSGLDFVAGDKNFGALKAKNVSFYDENAAVKLIANPFSIISSIDSEEYYQGW